MSIFKTEKLSVGYGNKTVVEGINLEALKGQLICLLGPNGSGKSTILKSLCGFLSPVGGGIYLKNKDITQMKSQDMAKTMAVVLTERLSPGLMNGFDIASMGRYPYTGFLGKLSDLDIKKTWDALRLVNAEDIAYSFFNELSDGQKQKLLLARALVQEPELIILDEPTTHLDVRHRIEVMGILNSLTKEKGITVILSLHEIDLALKSCEVAILVKNNKILALGAPEDIIEEDTITNLFDIKAANYNDFLGTVELANSFNPSTFVVSGAGTGINIYRMLTKQGHGIYTGVLHENDVDYHVANTIGLNIISERPFESISDMNFTISKKQIEKADQVIDSNFPIGLLNEKNTKLILYALSLGKPVYSLRKKEECKEIYGIEEENIIYCENIKEMVDLINESINNKYIHKKISKKKVFAGA